MRVRERELSEKAEHCHYSYEDYMCNQPMRDGLEIRNFLNEDETQKESEEV